MDPLSPTHHGLYGGWGGGMAGCPSYSVGDSGVFLLEEGAEGEAETGTQSSGGLGRGCCPPLPSTLLSLPEAPFASHARESLNCPPHLTAWVTSQTQHALHPRSQQVILKNASHTFPSPRYSLSLEKVYFVKIQNCPLF